MSAANTYTVPGIADELRAAMSGGVALQEDPAYDDARQVWNGAVDRRPAAIAFCAGAADVQAAVRVAQVGVRYGVVFVDPANA